MFNIFPMKIRDIPFAISIWCDQFARYCSCDSFPDFRLGGQDTIAVYLEKQIEKGNAIVALQNDTIVGYLAWQYFDFHGERTAFLPTVGSAAIAEHESVVLHSMYSYAAQIWIRDDRFNHLWMTFYNDNELKETLYNLGFGSYVVDVCQNISTAPTAKTSDWKVTVASEADAEAILSLANESSDNLFASPTFLVYRQWEMIDIVELLKEHRIFIAWDGKRIIGTMGVDSQRSFHRETLTTTNSACSGGIGAYIVSEYRGKGIGTRLLQECFSYCRDIGKSHLHISFETANPDAIVFWPKHLKPFIRSVRRTVNKDANKRKQEL